MSKEKYTSIMDKYGSGFKTLSDYKKISEADIIKRTSEELDIDISIVEQVIDISNSIGLANYLEYRELKKKDEKNN